MQHLDLIMSLKWVITAIKLPVEYVLFPICLYFFIISFFGWFKRKNKGVKEYGPAKKFAIVVAAHNEEAVVGNIVRNLKAIDYPEELFDIFVVADNCSDNTATIARESGAIAYERYDDKNRGKGFALNWMFKKIFSLDNKYDAFCVFDADNLVSPNFLKEMNNHLCSGHKVVQGYLDSKNPSDSIIAGSYAITYWLNNRLFQLARYYLGLNCAIGGTGFTVSSDILKKFGWEATSLTEDLEFSIKLALKDYRIYWSHEVIVYDEKPLTMAQSWRQRKRWMQGQSDCACRYLKALLVKAVKDRDIRAFDVSMYVMQPLIIVLSGFVLIANFIIAVLNFNPDMLLRRETVYSLLLFFLTTYICFIFVALEGRINLKIFGYFLMFPLYNLTWIPIIIQGFLGRNNKEWSHTVHTRSIEITEMHKLGHDRAAS